MTVQDLYTDVAYTTHMLHLLVDYKEHGIQSTTLVDTPTETMKLLAFDQGTRLKEHTAPHDVHLLILEGNAEVMIEGKPLQLSAGELITLPATQPHAVEAKTRFKMQLTMFRT